MNYRPFGRTGLQISPLALGTDNLANPTPEEESLAILDAAVAGGINLIDTSNSYAKGEAERIIGKWLKRRGKRDDVLIATKVFYPTSPNVNDRGLSRRHIMQACEESLARLGTDYIDVYQTHRPDMSVAMDEILRAMDDLVTQGKVRMFGSTTAPAWWLTESLFTSQMNGWVKFASEQSPYNLLDRRIENELIPMCQRHNLAVLVWSPMAMGMLAGRYASADVPPPDSRAILRGGIYADRITKRGVEVGNAFAQLARAHGYDPAQLAILWAKDQPGITAPIIGPRTLAQLQNLLPVLGMALSDELRAACDELVAPGSVVCSFFNTAPWMKWKFV
ncbi:MAG TPA: aldo/keto reductase [Thermoflexales bacterium]|nr:aldo/keto reductase [Thermoflexales bacterium]HQW36672.1 aldo/keto reductase [Thermoflexales bacterium]HQX76185.1 aldo/keto reductase [Thermoflexales bacterium]HQZ21591.1 aldo/keto reductase [Thermoflexales bacterium]HRA01025.1 aldo/keto reductase [Thermoflexales bacterium]